MDPVHVAAAALVARLDAIHEDPSYVGVFTFYQIHGFQYDGPTYSKELADLREALVGHRSPPAWSLELPAIEGEDGEITLGAWEDGKETWHQGPPEAAGPHTPIRDMDPDADDEARHWGPRD